MYHCVCARPTSLALLHDRMWALNSVLWMYIRERTLCMEVGIGGGAGEEGKIRWELRLFQLHLCVFNKTPNLSPQVNSFPHPVTTPWKHLLSSWAVHFLFLSKQLLSWTYLFLRYLPKNPATPVVSRIPHCKMLISFPISEVLLEQEHFLGSPRKRKKKKKQKFLC